MSALGQGPVPTRRPRAVLVWSLLFIGAAAGVLWAMLPPRHKPAPAPANGNAEMADRLPDSFGPYQRQDLDDSGYAAAQSYFLPVQDPQSLEHIRDCIVRAGYRAAAGLEQELLRSNQPLEDLTNKQIQLALLYLYEGEFLKGYEVLAELRRIVLANPRRLESGLPTVVFLQGIAALRRAETENCVRCQCDGSCIFPIQAQAIHNQREGSRLAIQHFTEYLERRPEDVGVRWLLNVAYMTLGQYPDQVPPAFLIPPNTFASEFDIGHFTDLAPRLQLNRLQESGGAIMDDFHNRGLLDLVVTSFDPAVPLALYRNRGDGTFEERAAAAGLAGQIGGLYCVQTDYNNDGHLDIYVARGAWLREPQRHSLLRNNGDGTFTDVTEQAGLATPMNSQAVAWADYDNDGHLDLFVGGERQRSRLYHNRGDGTFEEVALSAGVGNEGFMCKGANWGDFDGDGYPDLYLSNFRGLNRLFHNNGNGTFTDVAPQLGVTRPEVSFPCWFFDYDNDGWLDLFVASFDNTLENVASSHLGLPHQGETCRLYRNLGGKGFEDVSGAAGLDWCLPVMGCNFADFDNDGYLDLYLGTGAPKYSMLVPNRMFKNVQGKRFADITTSSGTGHLQKGHAVACGDWDRNGTVDLFAQLGGATPGDQFRSAFFQNPGQGNHWLTVKLIGKKTNRAAIGARIKVTLPEPEPRAIYRHVNSGASFGANPLQQTIGLGKAEKVASLEVYWPTSKTTQVFRDLPVDKAIELTEFAGEYRLLDRPPIAASP
jgi:hypothetical protein